MKRLREAQKAVSSEQCIELIKACQSRLDQVMNNTPLMPMDIERYIRYDKLFWEEYDNGIVFFVRERDFDKLFCYVEELSDIILLPQNRPQVIEVIQTTRRQSHWTEVVSSGMIQYNFEPYVKNIRVRTAVESAIIREMTPDQFGEMISVDHARLSDMEELYRIWEQNLDRYDSILPTETELIEWIRDEEIVLIRHGERIASAARMKHENKRTFSCWLVVTENTYKGHGYASLLYNSMLILGQKKGYQSAAQWCDIDNSRILKTIEKFGFAPDGNESIEYIIK